MNILNTINLESYNIKFVNNAYFMNGKKLTPSNIFDIINSDYISKGKFLSEAEKEMLKKDIEKTIASNIKAVNAENADIFRASDFYQSLALATFATSFGKQDKNFCSFLHTYMTDGTLLVYVSEKKGEHIIYHLWHDTKNINELNEILDEIKITYNGNEISASEYMNAKFNDIIKKSKNSLKQALIAYNNDKVTEILSNEFFASLYHYGVASIEAGFKKINNDKTKKKEEEEIPVLYEVRIGKKSSSSKAPDYISLNDYFENIIANCLGNLNRLESQPVTYSSLKDENTMNFFDLDSLKMQNFDNVKTEAWQEYLTHFTADEQEVFKAYIWSIFDSRNKSRQCLYLYDNGYSGKSVLQNVLFKKIKSACALQKLSNDDRFIGAKLWDKRLVIITDNKDPNIIRSAILHKLAGHDLIDVEYKFSNSFTALSNCKFVIAGNVLPNIDPSAFHETTRLILLKPALTDAIKNKIFRKDANGKIHPVGDINFESKLYDEFDAFLINDCYTSYKKLCPTEGEIILPDSVVDRFIEASSNDADIFEHYFYEKFELKEGASISAFELRKNFIEYMKDEATDFANFKAYGNFINYLDKNFSVFKVHTKKGSIFQNIAFKNETQELNEKLKYTEGVLF